jgi:hypothetical protein
MDNAYGKKSGGREGDRGSEAKPKASTRFQPARARARAGTITKSSPPTDSILNPTATNTSPGAKDVRKTTITKSGIRSMSGNDPFKRPTGFPKVAGG